jgi:hypothetical protein
MLLIYYVVRLFWDLTRDFWAENGKRNFTRENLALDAQLWVAVFATLEFAACLFVAL